jgi:DNA modification methylase
VTNVWSHPPLAGTERFKGNGKRSAPRIHNPGKNATVHLNQKPLEFMRRIVIACTAKHDVVWEPFGGLCSASVAAIELDRRPFAAEPNPDFFALAKQRIADACRRYPALGNGSRSSRSTIAGRSIPRTPKRSSSPHRTSSP